MKKQIKELLIILNSTCLNGLSPIGNKDLMDKIKKFNIVFDSLTARWIVKK